MMSDYRKEVKYPHAECGAEIARLQLALEAAERVMVRVDTWADVLRGSDPDAAGRLDVVSMRADREGADDGE